MEPEPEDEEQAAATNAAAAAAKAPDESAVATVRVDVAGHEVTAGANTLDVSGWKLTAAQVREVAGALSQLPCLRELILDGLPVSGSTPRRGDLRCGVETLDADLDTFQALCEGLRVRPTLTSLSLKRCYLGPQALALLAEVVFRDASAAMKRVVLSHNFLFGSKDRTSYDSTQIHDVDAVQSGWSALCDVLPASPLEELIVADIGMGVTGVISLAKAISSMAALASLKMGHADFGSVYVTGEAAFQVDLTAANNKGGKLGFRNRPDMGDKCGQACDDGSTHTPIEQTDDWIQIAANRWLPKKYLIELDTLTPCVFQMLCDALKTSQVTEVDFSHCGLGSPAMKILSDYVRDARAVLASLTLSGNRITDWDRDLSGLVALGEAIVPSKTLKSIDLSDCGIKVKGVTEVAKFISAGAAVKKITLSNNFLFGSKFDDDLYETVHDNDADQSGWSALCDALPASPLEELIAVDIGMGVTGVTSLAKAISAGAAVKKVALSKNFLFGSKPKYSDGSGGLVHIIDADQNGWSALCDALPSSPLEELIVADVGMGVTGVTSLAKAISSMAVLASVNFCGNGLTGAAKEFEQWKNIDSDLSGFVSLCTVLGKVTEVNLSDCGLGPASMPELANIFSDPSAAIEKVNVSGCNVTKETAAQLLTAANEASRVRLRTHQLLTFSEAFHERLGSECLLQAVAFNADIWGRVAENVRERHGHELMCSQLAQAGQTWFEVTVEGFLVLDPLLDDPLGWLEYVLDPRSPRGFLADG
jgi:hypothetical protein